MDYERELKKMREKKGDASPTGRHDAPAPPKQGDRIHRIAVGAVIVVAAFVGLGIISAMISPGDKTPMAPQGSAAGTSKRDAERRERQATEPKAKPKPTYDSSPEAQADRKKFIEKLIGQGVVQKSEWTGSLPKLWITPRFMALDYDTKKGFAGVAWVYWAVEVDGFGDGLGDILVLKHSLTGNDVGSFTPTSGLTIDK